MSAKGVIRVVFAKNPPDAFTTCNSFPVLTPTMDCPFPGWLVEVTKMLADYLNLRIDPIIIGFIANGWNNGNWTGVMGILQQGMADTVCTLYPYTEQKAHFFDFSHPVTGVRDMYITKPKQKTISLALWNAFLPYEPKLWGLMLLSLVIQCGLASLMSSIEFRLNLRSTYSPLEKVWQYLRLQIHQTTEFQTPFRLQSGNLAFLVYALIQATLFTQLYTAVLLSALIRGQNPRPWESYKEMVNLIRAGTYSMVMDKHHLEKDNTFYETLLYTNISTLRNMADAIKHNPIIVVGNVTQALDYVERGGYILPTKQYSLAYQLSKERCDFFYFEDDNNQISTFFLFSKASKALREWNRAIQNNQAFIRRTYEKYFFHEFNTGNLPKCKQTAGKRPSSVEDEQQTEHGPNSRNVGNAFRSLDIVSTFGIFLIALIGFCFALLAFLCELLVDAKARRLHRKWRTRRALVFTATQPTHLMSIAKQMDEQRRRAIVHADSGDTNTDQALFSAMFSEGLPRLAKGIEKSWWQRRTRRAIQRQETEMNRQSAIVSAAKLTAMSSICEENGKAIRRRRGEGDQQQKWMMVAEENGGRAAGWKGEGEARTAF